jgi:uncharacterized membrane protein
MSGSQGAPTRTEPAPRYAEVGERYSRAVFLRVAVVVVLAVASAAAVGAGLKSPVRAVLSLSFLLFGPGLALTELLEIREFAQRVTIAVSASLGMETLLALALVYAGAFSATLAVMIVAALTLAILAASLVRVLRFRHMSREPTVPAE